MLVIISNLEMNSNIKEGLMDLCKHDITYVRDLMACDFLCVCVGGGGS